MFFSFFYCTKASYISLNEKLYVCVLIFADRGEGGIREQLLVETAADRSCGGLDWF